MQSTSKCDKEYPSSVSRTLYCIEILTSRVLALNGWRAQETVRPKSVGASTFG